MAIRVCSAGGRGRGCKGADHRSLCEVWLEGLFLPEEERSRRRPQAPGGGPRLTVSCWSPTGRH